MKAKSKKFNFLGTICAIVFGVLTAYSNFLLLQNVFKVTFELSVGIAFSVQLLFTGLIIFHKSSRCVFFLLIPQFFSKRGRSAIVAYTLYLAITGPGADLMKNVEVLSDSLACGQVTNGF